MPDKDNLDLLLDSAMATYGDPGPDSALEQRVLSSLAVARAAEQESRAGAWSLRWLGWAIAVPVAASLLLWIAINRTLHAPTVQTDQAKQPQTTHTTAPASGQTMAQYDRPQGAKAHTDLVAHTGRLKPCLSKAADLEAAPGVAALL